MRGDELIEAIQKFAKARGVELEEIDVRLDIDGDVYDHIEFDTSDDSAPFFDLQPS
jgi:hypothetical protein